MAVLNGTNSTGLASRIADQLQQQGFVRGNTTNSPTQGQQAQSVVEYSANNGAAARLVASKLGISDTEPIDTQTQQRAGDANVAVIIGADKVARLGHRFQRPATTRAVTFPAVPSSLLVRVVFGALVIATLGAFVVTQRLKRSTPIVERVYYYGPCTNGVTSRSCGRSSFSPTSRYPRVRLRFQLPKRQEGVTVSIVNADGDDVRTLIEGRTLRRGFHSYGWNGRGDDGKIVPDGPYRLRGDACATRGALSPPRAR